MTFLYLLGLAIAQGRNENRSRSGSFREGQSDEERRRGEKDQPWRSAFLTLIYCGCFFCFGTTMAILGPTLIELGQLVHHGLDMMSWLFFTQSSYALLGASMAGIVLDSGFFMFGMSTGVTGPAMTDYLISFFSDIDIIDALSWIIFTQSTTRFLGAICAGFLVERFDCNRHMMLLIFVLLNSVFLAIIPLCRTLWLLILSTAAAGFCVGILDTATNVQLITLHGKKVSPYLQALYFSYGFGAFVSPLIAEPFLSGTPHPDLGLSAVRRERPLPYGGAGHRHHHHMDHLQHIERRPTVSDGGFFDYMETSTSQVQFAYWIIALAHLPVVLGLTYITISEKWEKYKIKQREQVASKENTAGLEVRETDKHEEHENDLARSGICNSPNKTHILCLTFWMSFLVFLYDGMQGSYGGYVYTYAVKSDLHMTSAEGAFLTSVFWGSLALGRLISIPIAMFMPPAKMLMVDLIGSLTSSFLMLLFKSSTIALWMGTSSFGLFMSNVFPTSVALAEQYFNVTGTITCIFVVSAAIGEMIIPLIVGKVFDYIGPISFLAEGFILSIVAIGAYLAVVIMSNNLPSQAVTKEKESGEKTDNKPPITSEDPAQVAVPPAQSTTRDDTETSAGHR